MNENNTLHNHIVEHCLDSMNEALSEERHPLWKRSCPEMSDIDFIRFGLLRCMGVADSGQHFLTTTEAVHDENIPHSTYFNSIKSPRRTRMLKSVERQSSLTHCKTLAAQGID